MAGGGSGSRGRVSRTQPRVTIVKCLTDDREMLRSQLLLISTDSDLALQDIGLSDEKRCAVVAAHGAARAGGLYDADSYMASNPQEYWAEGEVICRPAASSICKFLELHRCIGADVGRRSG